MLLPLTIAMLTAPGPSEFGLVEGATYTYEVRNKDQKPFRYTAKVGKHFVVQGIDTFDVLLSTKRHEFLGVSDKGLFQFHVRNMEGTEIDSKSPPIPLYLRNSDDTKTWKWVEPFRGQTMADEHGNGPDLEKLKSTCTGQVLSQSEKVGSWVTLHVRITRKSEGLGDSTTDTWYAPRIGKVRELVLARDWQSETVLIP